MTAPRGPAGAADVRLVIPREPPPLLNRALRAHWGVRRRLRDLWLAEVAAAWHAAGRPRFRRARVTVACHYRTRRRRDWDGIVGSLKPVLDGLVACGCVPDDDAGTVRLTVEVGVDRGRPRVELRLSPWEPVHLGPPPGNEGAP